MRALTHFGCLAFLLAVAGSFNAAAEARFSFESTPGKLPKTVVPRHYALRLEPDLEKFTTRGKVEIDVDVLKPVRQIVLNALDMRSPERAWRIWRAKPKGQLPRRRIAVRTVFAWNISSIQRNRP